jgi:uncharacterized membrane protein
MHPFYGSSARLLRRPGAADERLGGLVSMAAYLAFWAAALAIARRELDARLPAGAPRRAAGAPDPALVLLRQRFAAGELDEAEFRAMRDVLAETAGHSP